MTAKNIYISYLRVIATVFVVAIHASTGFLNNFSDTSFNWNYANWINSFTRCSVPLFVVISGALLLNKEENISTFYKKRLPNLIYPFIFWTIVYLIYYFYRYTNFSILPIEKIIAISREKLTKGANAHLWYMYMIIGLYLAIPYLRKIVNLLSKQEMEWFLIFWVVSMFTTNRLLDGYVMKFDLTFFAGYTGYLVLGYYLSKYPTVWKANLDIIGYIGISVITALGTSYLSQSTNKFNPFLYNYVFINTALGALFLFSFFFKKLKENKDLPTWLKIIDEHSFGIYLVHIIPLNYVHPIISKHVSTGLVIPIATVVTIIFSILITFLLRKLPFGKHVSG